MQTLKINKDGTLSIPKDLRSFFKPSDKLIWFMEGDTLIIKRINPPKLSEIAERVKENPMPLKEIVKEVHAYRSEKKKK
ncbi:MAG: hypothetical protein ACMUIL_12855 [bacterium]